MTDAVQRGAFTAQPTCCLRQRLRITGLRLCSLEISHACRLRKKLACDFHRLVINTWGVGLKLLD